MAEKYKRNPNTNCAVCKKAVYKRPSEIDNKRGQTFCSLTCYGLSCRKEHPCVVCGKPIMASLNKKTCSRSCSNTHRAGIKYKIGRPRDKAKSQQSLKIKLLEDRGETCERCTYNKQEILQVHHKDRDRENNTMENLELLCPNCHYEDHHLKKKWLKNIK